MTIDPILVGLLMIFGGVLILFTGAGVVIINTFDPDARRERALHRQAMMDYANARGTSHLKLLKTAKKNMEEKARLIEKEIVAQKEKISDLEKQRIEALRKALETHIVTTRFHEVPGIGNTLRELIIHSVFRGKLTDLKHAYRINGVGETRQAYINYWVDKYLSQILELMKGDFPEKKKIIDYYVHEVESAHERLKKLLDRKDTLEQMIGRANHEIESLAKIHPSDFEMVLNDPSRATESFELYLRGCFAEWEPIPEWFKQIIEMGEVNV